MLIHQSLQRVVDVGTKVHSIVQLFLSILFLSVPILLQGQVGGINQKLFSAFDSIIGEQNMEMYNGPIFRERLMKVSDTHPYFLQSDFMRGDVMFDGQSYFGQNIKYHIHSDELLVTPKYTSTGLLVRLIKSKVDEFTIEGHRFIRLQSAIADGDEYGYLEVLEKGGDHMLLKKYRKKSVESRREDQVVIEYEEREDYFLLFEGNLIEANKKGQWNNIFTDRKKELRNFFKQNRIAYKSDKDTFFKLLFNKLANTTDL